MLDTVGSNCLLLTLDRCGYDVGSGVGEEWGGAGEVGSCTDLWPVLIQSIYQPVPWYSGWSGVAKQTSRLWVQIQLCD